MELTNKKGEKEYEYKWHKSLGSWTREHPKKREVNLVSPYE